MGSLPTFGRLIAIRPQRRKLLPQLSVLTLQQRHAPAFGDQIRGQPP
jgi:hypothetical protein